MGMAHHSQPNAQRPGRSTPHRIRHLRPQSGLPHIERRAKTALRLAPRKPAPPSPGPYRIRYRQARGCPLHPTDSRPMDRHPAQRIRMARPEDHSDHLLPSDGRHDCCNRPGPHSCSLRISLRLQRHERGRLDAPGEAHYTPTSGLLKSPRSRPPARRRHLHRQHRLARHSSRDQTGIRPPLRTDSHYRSPRLLLFVPTYRPHRRRPFRRVCSLRKVLVRLLDFRRRDRSRRRARPTRPRTGAPHRPLAVPHRHTVRRLHAPAGDRTHLQ